MKQLEKPLVFICKRRRVHAGKVPGGCGDSPAVQREQGAADQACSHFAAAPSGSFCPRALRCNLPQAVHQLPAVSAQVPLRKGCRWGLLPPPPPPPPPPCCITPGERMAPHATASYCCMRWQWRGLRAWQAVTCLFSIV